MSNPHSIPPPMFGSPFQEINRPMNASGTVIDIHGTGIPGVAVHYYTSFYAGRNPKGQRVYKLGEIGVVTTRSDGTFEIKDPETNYVTIENVEKAGYVHPRRVFEDVTEEPNPSGEGPRLEFLMLPAAGTPEIRIRERMSTLPTGVTSFRFDLDSGEISDSGNAAFRFTLFTTPPPVKFKRISEIVIAGVPTQPVLRWLAPVDGYRDQSNGTSTDSRSEDSFYYRRGDRFGRVVIRISDPSPSGEHRVLFQNYFNESGGRNTEPVLPTDDDETLKRTSRVEYDRLRKERLDQADEAGILDDGSMSTADLVALLGPPDREENGVIFYHLIEGFATSEWSFTVENDRITFDDIGSITEK